MVQTLDARSFQNVQAGGGAVRRPARIAAEEAAYLARLLHKSYHYLLTQFENFKPATRVQIALELIKRRIPLELHTVEESRALVLVRMESPTQHISTSEKANISNSVAPLIPSSNSVALGGGVGGGAPTHTRVPRTRKRGTNTNTNTVRRGGAQDGTDETPVGV